MRAIPRTSLGAGMLLFWRYCTCCIAFVGDYEREWVEYLVGDAVKAWRTAQSDT